MLTTSLPNLEELEDVNWRLGVLTDGGGRVHLGAVIANGENNQPEYMDLLAPVGADRPTEADLARLVVLVQGDHLTELRRLAENCIDDGRFRARLVALMDLATPGALDRPWD
jgi:hypothetical protein